MAAGGRIIGRHCYEVSHGYAVPCDQAGEIVPAAPRQRSRATSSASCTCITRRAARSTCRWTSTRCATARGDLAVRRADVVRTGARAASSTQRTRGPGAVVRRDDGAACRAWRAPTRRCCCSARRAPARRWWRARSTRRAPARNAPFVAVDCSGPRRDAGRERTVRAREGRVHRRARTQGRTRRGGCRRHAVPRRGRRHPARPAGEAAATARDRHVPPRRRRRAAARELPADRRDASRPAAARARRAVPRRPVLPPRRLPDPAAATARAPRGHSRCSRSRCCRAIGAAHAHTLARTRSSACAATTTPATSASCATSSSAPACSRTVTRSSRGTCRRRSVSRCAAAAQRALSCATPSAGRSRTRWPRHAAHGGNSRAHSASASERCIASCARYGLGLKSQAQRKSPRRLLVGGFCLRAWQ